MTDLPTLIIVAVISIAAGALSTCLFWMRARHRLSEPQTDSGFAGLATLDGWLTNVHTRLTDLLKEQTTAGERLAVVGKQTADLHMTLASHQRRGRWGGALCDDIFAWAGLQPGVNYKTQRTLPNGARPDFSVFMADGRELHVDAKFPAKQAETDETSGRECATSLRRHIRAVASRGYSDPAATVGFVVLFVANPAVLGAAVEADPDIIKYALSQQVVLADAQTLMAILTLVRSASDALRVQSGTGDILRIIQEFRAEWKEFTGHLDKVDRQMSTVTNSWESLNTTRRRQLHRRLERIDGLDIGDEPTADTMSVPTALSESIPSDEPQSAPGSASA